MIVILVAGGRPRRVISKGTVFFQEEKQISEKKMIIFKMSPKVTNSDISKINGDFSEHGKILNSTFTISKHVLETLFHSRKFSNFLEK